MYLIGLQADLTICKCIYCVVASHRALIAGEIHANNGIVVIFNFSYSSFSDDRASLCPGFRSHLNEPVRFLQDLRVMVDQQNGVPVPYQVVHDTVQSDNICGMQTD